MYVSIPNNEIFVYFCIQAHHPPLHKHNCLLIWMMVIINGFMKIYLIFLFGCIYTCYNWKCMSLLQDKKPRGSRNEVLQLCYSDGKHAFYCFQIPLFLPNYLHTCLNTLHNINLSEYHHLLSLYHKIETEKQFK